MPAGPRKGVIDLDGVAYGLSGDKLAYVRGLDEIKGDKYYVTDLQEGLARVMTIESPVKYADLMVRKQLQDTGEFNEPVTVVTHWKKAKGGNTSEIFFTAAPARLYNRVQDQAGQDENNVLVFPLFAVLHGLLRRLRPADPVAVAFQHGRYVDLLIGSRERVYYANRCVAFDASPEQITFLWETVKNEINSVEADHQITVARVYLLNWVDSGAPPEWPDSPERRILTLEESPVVLDGQTHFTSLVTALKMQSGRWSISSFREKLSYYARRYAAAANVFFLLAALALFGGYVHYGRQADLIQKDLNAFEQRLARVRQPAAETDAQDFQATAAFIKELDYCRRAPSFRQVVEDMSGALPVDMRLDVIKADFGAREVGLELFGRIETPFDTAYQGYQSLLDALKSKGYAIKENRLTTEITSSRFLLKLTRGIK
ncbi:MAG: hypothetical protein AB1641_14235 [Thermodesulfobacteriota bacterium]